MINESNLEEQTNYLLTYDLQDSVIAKLNAEAKAIVVSSWEDEESVKTARKLRTEIRALFEKVDRRRKDLKNFIDKKGKAVTALIEEPIFYLDSQIAIRDNEIKRQKEEVERKRREIVSERERLLREQGCDTAIYMLDPDFCTDEKFATLLETARNERLFKIEQEKRAAEEQKAKDAELERLRAENAELKFVAVKSTAEPISLTAYSEEEVKTNNERLNTILAAYPSKIDLGYRIIELEDKLFWAEQGNPDEALF